MDKSIEKDKNVQDNNYPRPSTSDKQHDQQDEFVNLDNDNQVQIMPEKNEESARKS